MGLLPQNDFGGLYIQPLFGNNFRSQSTIQQGGDYVTATTIGLESSKNTVNQTIKSWRSMFIEVTLNIIVNYINDCG